MDGVIWPFLIYQSGLTFLNTAEIVTNGRQNNALTVIVAGRLDTRFIGPKFLIIAKIVRVGMKSSVRILSVLDDLIFTVIGTIPLNTAQTVENGKKKPVVIESVTVM